MPAKNSTRVARASASPRTNAPARSNGRPARAQVRAQAVMTAPEPVMPLVEPEPRALRSQHVPQDIGVQAPEPSIFSNGSEAAIEANGAAVGANRVARMPIVHGVSPIIEDLARKNLPPVNEARPVVASSLNSDHANDNSRAVDLASVNAQRPPIPRVAEDNRPVIPSLTSIAPMFQRSSNRNNNQDDAIVINSLVRDSNPMTLPLEILTSDAGRANNNGLYQTPLYGTLIGKLETFGGGWEEDVDEFISKFALLAHANG